MEEVFLQIALIVHLISSWNVGIAFLLFGAGMFCATYYILRFEKDLQLRTEQDVKWMFKDRWHQRAMSLLIVVLATFIIMIGLCIVIHVHNGMMFGDLVETMHSLLDWTTLVLILYLTARLIYILWFSSKMSRSIAEEIISRYLHDGNIRIGIQAGPLHGVGEFLRNLLQTRYPDGIPRVVHEDVALALNIIRRLHIPVTVI